MKCALIGLGMVADTHVAALQDSKDVSLAGVMGRDASKARDFANRHGVEIVFEDVSQVAASDVDFVILATPPDARQEIVQALIKGRKPILMEKPIERDLGAATRIVEQCEEASIPLGIVFQHRARAASLTLKQAIADGSLGQVSNTEIRVPWWRDQGYYDAPGRGSYARDGGGVMITQAIHTLDLALWLLGPVTHVQALMHRTALHQLEAEDWAAGILRFDSGAVASLAATTSAFPGGSESLIIQGTLGAAHLADGVLTLSFLDGREEVYGATATTGGGADPMAFTHDWHQSVIEDFATSLRENRPPLAPGRQALAAHAVIDAMERASKTRAEVTM